MPERTGKELTEGWDMVNLAKPIPPQGAKRILKSGGGGS